MWRSRAIAIAATIIGSIAVSIIFAYPPSSTTTGIRPSDRQPPTSGHYANLRYGFSLDFPETWKGFRTTTHEYGPSGPYSATVCFWFDRRHSPNLCVLQIIVLTPAQWARTRNGDATEVVPLLRTAQFVLSADSVTNSSSLDAFTCLQMDEFQCDRRREAPQILASISPE